MIAQSPGGGEELSPAALDEIRDLWGSGVPVGQLAGWWDVPLDSLMRQMYEHLKRRAADLQARQRGCGAANE